MSGPGVRRAAVADFRFTSLEEISSARRTVETAATERDLPAGQVADAVLLMSELMSNAVRHTDTTGPRVRIDLVDLDIRVAVTDASPTLPVRLGPDPGRVGGNGMLLVDALASAWGIVSHDGLGKTIWCRVPVTS